MSTDITRGPKICPSCGKENQPRAARCWLCFTPLGGAIQTTTAPAPGEVRLSAPLRTQPKAGPRSGCATVAGCVSVAILTIISAGVTFFLVCSATLGVVLTLSQPPSNISADDSLHLLYPAAVAAVLVATLVIVAFVRRRRR